MATHSSIPAWKIPWREEAGVTRSWTQLTTPMHAHMPTNILNSQSQVTALYKSGKFSLFVITVSVTFILTCSLGKSDVFLFILSESWEHFSRLSSALLFSNCMSAFVILNPALLF